MRTVKAAGVAGLIFAIKTAAAFMLVTSTIGRRTGFLPRWFIVVGFVAGIGLLALVFPAWVAILSGILLLVRRSDWEHLRTTTAADETST